MEHRLDARTKPGIDYDAVCRRIDALAGRGWEKRLVTEADGYPVFMLERKASPREGRARPSLLIDAGIHGEEPAGVLGLLDWLEKSAEQWAPAIDFTVFPCLNPWGIERGLRFDPRGRDLNREFNNPVHPAVASFCRAVSDRRFDLFMDLHEDCDFFGMYLYEVAEPKASGLDGEGSGPSGADSFTPDRTAAGRASSRRAPGRPTLGRAILDTCRRLVPLSDGDDVGGITTRNGMVAGSLTRDEIEAWDQWPIALYAFVKHTDHVVTVETPGKQPLELRRTLHGIALDIACRRLVEGSPTAKAPARNASHEGGS